MKQEKKIPKVASGLFIALCTVVLIVFETSTVAHARGGGRPGGPPPEAVQACADASSGDSCSFEGQDGTVSGTCRTPPSDDRLICVPDSH